VGIRFCFRSNARTWDGNDQRLSNRRHGRGWHQRAKQGRERDQLSNVARCLQRHNVGCGRGLRWNVAQELPQRHTARVLPHNAWQRPPASQQHRSRSRHCGRRCTCDRRGGWGRHARWASVCWVPGPRAFRVCCRTLRVCHQRVARISDCTRGQSECVQHCTSSRRCGFSPRSHLWASAKEIKTRTQQSPCSCQRDSYTSVASFRSCESLLHTREKK
jgi:hypothetical protein